MDAPQGRCSRSGIDLLLSVGDSTRRRYTVVWSAGAGPGMGFVGWGVREAATGEAGMAGSAPRRGCLAVWWSGVEPHWWFRRNRLGGGRLGRSGAGD